MRILLVEPDAATRQSIKLMLKSESFNVFGTDRGEEAIDLGKLYDYDLIIMELNLPDMSGHDVIKQLRVSKISTPILICSGLTSIEDVVKGLDCGADDYMTKPLHKDELVARIHAIIRRSKGHAVSIITTGNLSVNISTKTVAVNGVQVRFTVKEYAILELLSLRKGMTISKEMLLSYLYGGRDEPYIKIIDVFICKIRKKLRAVEGHDVETVWGRGYLLRDDTTASAPSPSLAPELQEMADQTGIGFVPMRPWGERRVRDEAEGKIKAPSIVPAQGQR